jgi:opacity protein-like surface antigen
MNAKSCRLFPVAMALAVLVSPANLEAQNAGSFQQDATNAVPPGAALSGHDYVAPLTGKIYLGLDVGVAWQKNITLSDGLGGSETVKYDPGARFDVAMGYNLTPHWAAELELGFVISPVQSSYALGTDYVSVDLIELPLMVNVIYTRPLGRWCSAYVGGGVGGVFIHYQDAYFDTTPTASTFGYQGMAGLRFVINPILEIGLGYKYLATTGYDVGSGIAYHAFVPTEFRSDGNQTQSVLLTLTRRF